MSTIATSASGRAAEDDPMAGSQDLPADPAQATEEATEEQSTDPRNAAVPKLTPAGLPVADSVIEAGTRDEREKYVGFPIDTLEGRIMCVNKNADGTLQGEDGQAYERSGKAHIYQPAGTAEKNAEDQAKAQAKAEKDAAKNDKS